MLGSLFNSILPKRKALDAPLVGVNGFTGRGAVAFALPLIGKPSFSVNLRGVSGRKAEVFVDGRQIGTIRIHNGRASMRFKAKKEQAGSADLSDGATVEIHQNGDAILKGVFGKNPTA